MISIRPTHFPRRYNHKQDGIADNLLGLDGLKCGACTNKPRYIESFDGGWCLKTTEVVWPWSRQANSCPYFE